LTLSMSIPRTTLEGRRPARSMVPVPFTLKVAGRDYSSDTFTAWSTDRVHGLVHFDGQSVILEWAGTSSIDEVQGLEVRSQTVPILPEAVSIPLSRLRSAQLSGGWWRPCVELTGNDLRVFAPIPGAAAGQVRLWIARRHRPHAIRFVESLHLAARQHGERPVAPA